MRRLSSFVEPHFVDGITGAVGSTPLVRLKRASEATGCNVVAKCEFMNPGGSVKDRAAVFILRDAEEKGLLRRGGEVVEGTAGNTGIGLAMVCAARGYRCKIFMPNTQSREKVAALRALGADVEEVPAVAYTDPLNFNHRARDYARGKDNVVWTDQFDNVANRYGHFQVWGGLCRGACLLILFCSRRGLKFTTRRRGLWMRSRVRLVRAELWPGSDSISSSASRACALYWLTPRAPCSTKL